MKKIDVLVGDVYGDWVITNINRPSKHKSRYVECRCKCGMVKDVNLSRLVNNKTSSCMSCARRKDTTILNKGDKFKYWTIIDGPIYINTTAKYKVRCECGTECFKPPVEILNKKRSIRCIHCSHKNNMATIRKNNGQVGELTRTRFTKIKRAALQRNYKFNVSMSFLWGLFIKQGRKCAITGDYISDLESASLDRINSNIGYTKDNVQWTTSQANLSKHIMTMDELYIFCIKVLSNKNITTGRPHPQAMELAVPLMEEMGV